MSGVQAIYLLLELNLPLQQHQYPLQEQKMMPMGLIVEKLLALSDAVPVEGAHSASQLVEKQLVVQPAPLLLATGQFSNTNIRRQATKPIILSNIQCEHIWESSFSLNFRRKNRENFGKKTRLP